MRLSILILFVAPSLLAQSPLPTSNPSVRAALDIIKADNAWTLQQQTELTQIPSPPFKESVRAAEFKKRLEVLGVTNVRIDSVGNVIAERPGTGNGPTVLIQGHLDTAFPEGSSISATAKMEVDMRSEGAASLAAIDVKVQKALRDAAPIVQTALNAAKALGFTSSTGASSTDANLPISLGIPAIRLGGGGNGEGAHSLGERYSDGPNGWLGPQWAALIVAALVGVR